MRLARASCGKNLRRGGRFAGHDGVALFGLRDEMTGGADHDVVGVRLTTVDVFVILRYLVIVIVVSDHERFMGSSSRRQRDRRRRTPDAGRRKATVDDRVPATRRRSPFARFRRRPIVRLVLGYGGVLRLCGGGGAQLGDVPEQTGATEGVQAGEETRVGGRTTAQTTLEQRLVDHARQHRRHHSTTHNTCRPTTR